MDPTCPCPDEDDTASPSALIEMASATVMANSTSTFLSLMDSIQIHQKQQQYDVTMAQVGMVTLETMNYG